MTSIDERGYANPDILVSTDWVAENLNKFQEQTENPEYRLVESNEDQLLYKASHIPGAIEIDWVDDLNDPVSRDYIGQEEFQELMRTKGIANDTTVVFYGDKSNWWSIYAAWVFKLFGHDNIKIMDGGSLKWKDEGRDTTTDIPAYPTTSYEASTRDDTENRAFRYDVLKHIEDDKPLVDVRSPEEFRGERLHIPGYPNEGALRGGHIPGAKSAPWSIATNEDGTFKTRNELVELYINERGIEEGDEVITYCRIGERSAHSWFGLKFLLGIENVRNYDGSWTEWGNAVGVPIEI